MPGSKVYELAKEYNVQSKDFVAILQEANIPVKSHMVTLTEQQEKYFRNNFTVIDGKLAPKDAPQQPAVKEAPKATKPQNNNNQNKEKEKAQPEKKQNTANQQQQQQRQPRQDNPNYQGNRQRQDGQGYQNRRSDNPNYQGNRPRQDGQGYQNRRSDNPNYQGNRQRQDGQGYQNRRSDNPNYQGNRQRQDGQGYQNRRSDNPNYQGSRPRQDGQGYNNQQRPQGSYQQGQKKPAETASGSIERPKIDNKNKKQGKQKNEAKNKARENFYSEENRPRLDNTKKTHGSKSEYKKKKLETREIRATSGVEGTVTIPDAITVSELSEKILISTSDIIKILMGYDILASINQMLDFDTVSIVCEELNISYEHEVEIDPVDVREQEHFADPDRLERRPPIVTVMGHVDHGKTSLLDYIRNTHVIKGEAGGITQHIGAYTVETKGRQVTFIDTPGHEAFTAMRSRGAAVTDVAVLVIAADDGIMPQTVEAINHAKAAGVPIVVAINKIDKPTANVDRVMEELTKYELVPEAWGGDTICVPVSAKTGQGIDDLLEMILLVADVEDLKANYDEKAIGTVIEARVDKQRGVSATMLIKSGILHTGDFIVSGIIYGKIRTMTDCTGKRITEAGPSIAAEVMGLSEVPSAGDKFFVAENEKEARSITEKKRARISVLASKAAAPLTLDDIFNQISQGELKEISVILKADVSGSLEAIKQSLEKLNDNEDGIRVSIIHSGVGNVTETDVSLASASKALLVAFNVKAEANTRKSAEREGVEIRIYNVIYDLIDDIESAMKGLKEPEYEEVVTGTAEVRATFKLPSNEVVAGSYITDGAVSRKDKARLMRDGAVIFDGSISSLKRFKDDVREVAAGYECGIGLEKFNDIKEGDTFEFYMLRVKEEN